MDKIRIDDVPELGQFLLALKSLCYRTTDQLIGAHRVVGNSLADYLKTDEERLRRLIDKIPRRPKPHGIPEVPPRHFALGARLDGIPRPQRALRMSAVSALPLPPKVNMIAQMPPVRDQGHHRGTCVAFACIAVYEHYLKLQNKYQHMSEEFLYWDCKENDQDPDEERTWIGVAMELLQRDGCCLESTWPYNPTPIPGNFGQGPPPDGAVAEALGFRVTTIQPIKATSIIDIKSELARNRCVAFSIPAFKSWVYNEEVQRTGEIVNPIPNEPQMTDDSGHLLGHAMCFAGYEDIPEEPDLGGGKFYIRNSWDGYWATEPVLGKVGYGTIPYSFIMRFAEEAYSIE